MEVKNKGLQNEKSSKTIKEQEIYLLDKLEKLWEGKYRTEEFLKMSKIEQINWMCDYVTSEENGFTNYFKNFPDHMKRMLVAAMFDGDCGSSPDEKPDWLDMEKFKKGQKFVVDHLFGVSFGDFLLLFITYPFNEEMKPIIFTGNSSTPFTAFKRYLSTELRVKSWYHSDPWTKGTEAYRNMQTVRKMHSNVRKKLMTLEEEEIDAACKIENPYCPTRDILLEDFRTSCPEPVLGQCPYSLLKNPEYKSLSPSVKRKALNQSDMVLTQFGFMALVLLYPKYFGIHNATDEDLEAFCHVWRGFGYLLGIDDEFNVCRGTLAEIKQRCMDYIELWVKPNFRELTPECEHMLRCGAEGTQFYSSSITYESCFLYVSEMLNLETPRLYSSLTYASWLNHLFLRFTFLYGCRVPGVLTYMNKQLHTSVDKVVNLTPEELKELKNRSDKILLNAQNRNLNKLKLA